MGTYIRQDQADIRLSIDGVPFFDKMATYAGGDITVTNAKTRAGAMGDEFDVGGPPSRNDITLTIQWNDVVLTKYSLLESKAGNGKAKVSINWLGRNKVAVPGGQFGRTGTIKGCSDPNYDHNGNAVGMLTIVIGCDFRPTS